MLLCGMIDKLQQAVARTVSISYFFLQVTDSRINKRLSAAVFAMPMSPSPFCLRPHAATRPVDQ